MLSRAKIKGLGKGIPQKKITNNYFVEQGLDTSNEWITTRTGIETRYFADSESTIDLAYEASIQAIRNANITTNDIEMIIVATTTPDYPSFPSTACLLQNKLECKHIPAFDVSAACSGFSYALNIASQFIATNAHKTILIVGADCLSKKVNFKDRTTCILFGDGAGAAVITASENNGILYSKCYSDGSEANSLIIPSGGTKTPLTKDSLENQDHTIKMDGKNVFKLAVSKTVEGINAGLQSLNLTVDDINYLVCHQANQRILNKIQNQLNIPDNKLLSNLKKYGNTSSASIPILLTEKNNENQFKTNDIIVLAGFGAGFTWGITIIKW